MSITLCSMNKKVFVGNIYFVTVFSISSVCWHLCESVIGNGEILRRFVSAPKKEATHKQETKSRTIIYFIFVALLISCATQKWLFMFVWPLFIFARHTHQFDMVEGNDLRLALIGHGFPLILLFLWY